MVKIPTVTFPVFTALWNESQNMTTPRPHRIIAAWLERQWESGQRRLLLMAFRACGKSTLTALLAAWLLTHNPNLRIMVVAADLLLAQKMVRQIRRVIERHPLTIQLVPPRADMWSVMQITVARDGALRDPSVLARSVQTNLTGSRADVIICDDVEVPGTADTPIRRMDLRDRLRELDYVLSPGGTILYLGTPHNYDSIYARDVANGSVEPTPFLADFTRFELPLLDARGESVWPERYPPDAIAHLRTNSGQNKFNSQMLLQPVSLADARLSPDLLRPYNDDLDYTEANGQSRLMLGETQMVGASCWWDPAFSGTKDSSVVALVFTDAAGNYYLHRLLYIKVRHPGEGRCPEESEAQQQCDQLADFLARHYVPSIRIESNGVGLFLPGILKATLARRGMGCAVQPQHSAGNKITRILEALEVPLAAGAIHAHRSVWQSTFITEMREWNPSRRDSRDDALDAVAGAISAMLVRVSGYARSARRPNWTGAPVMTTEKPFQF